MSKTKVVKKRSKPEPETIFPLAPNSDLHHETLDEITIPEEELSFEHITSKAECMSEAGKVSDQWRALLTQADKVRRYGIALIQWGTKRFGAFDQIGPDMAMPPQHVDGRKIPNPEKDLKISAVRAFGWAKQQGKDAEEARTRALKVVEAKARKDFSMPKIPEGVREYIDRHHKYYELIGTDVPIPQA
jgi:hypothetical protein